MEYILKTPVTDETLKKLTAGDTVLLSGTVYTARDAAHLRMTELIKAGKPLPVDINGAAIYYAGPTPERPGQIIGAAGPTTAGRMDAYTPALLDRGLKIMIGKGRRSAAVKDSIVKNGAVYLAAVGGAGALVAQHIKSAQIICWEDLGCEALRKLTVEALPLTVVIDARGEDLYDLGPENYLESLKK